MKIRLTINFKNGSKVKVIKRMSDPPKGTKLETHYMLEAQEMADCINNNGLSLSFSPAQIEKVII